MFSKSRINLLAICQDSCLSSVQLLSSINCAFNISLHFVTLCRLRGKKSDAEQGSAVSCSDYSLPSG